MTAREELKAHLSSWEYAYAMAVTCQGTKDYPVFVEARKRADELRARVAAVDAWAERRDASPEALLRKRREQLDWAVPEPSITPDTTE